MNYIKIIIWLLPVNTEAADLQPIVKYKEPLCARLIMNNSVNIIKVISLSQFWRQMKLSVAIIIFTAMSNFLIALLRKENTWKKWKQDKIKQERQKVSDTHALSQGCQDAQNMIFLLVSDETLFWQWMSEVDFFVVKVNQCLPRTVLSSLPGSRADS